MAWREELAEAGKEEIELSLGSGLRDEMLEAVREAVEEELQATLKGR